MFCFGDMNTFVFGFVGVEDVMTDYQNNKVVVKGEKADPLKVLERVQRKSNKQVELLSPIPKPPAAEEKKAEEKEKPKPEDKKEEVFPSFLFFCFVSKNVNNFSAFLISKRFIFSTFLGLINFGNSP